jgi:hypothetical protein
MGKDGIDREMLLDEIEEGFNIPELIRRTQESPSIIHERQLRLADARKALSDAEVELADSEATLTAIIATQINPSTGRPLFSNAEQRKAELIKRGSSDTEYLGAQQAVDAAKMSVNTAQFDLDRALNEFKINLVILDLCTSRISYLAG